MGDWKAKLTAKLGPFPVWVWAAAILALILGYMFFTKTGLFGAGSPLSAVTGQGGGNTPASDQGAGGSLGGSVADNIQALAARGTNPVSNNPGYGSPAQALAATDVPPGPTRGGSGLGTPFATAATYAGPGLYPSSTAGAFARAAQFAPAPSNGLTSAYGAGK